jgi:hypothetical protein
MRQNVRDLENAPTYAPMRPRNVVRRVKLEVRNPAGGRRRENRLTLAVN